MILLYNSCTWKYISSFYEKQKNIEKVKKKYLLLKSTYDELYQLQSENSDYQHWYRKNHVHPPSPDQVLDHEINIINYTHKWMEEYGGRDSLWRTDQKDLVYNYMYSNGLLPPKPFVQDASDIIQSMV